MASGILAEDAVVQRRRPLADERFDDPVRSNFRVTAARHLVLAALLYIGLAAPGSALSATQDMSRTSLEDQPYDWQDESGASVRFAQWHGKTLLLTMAYSTCREVCSYALHRLEQLQESADLANRPIEVIVISYDPLDDSPRSWSAYRIHHHLARGNWHFLTADAASTTRFAQAFGFPSWRYDEHIVHDFKILLIGPDGQVADTLNWAARNRDPFAAHAAPCSASDAKGCPQ
jgi:cytochrome oxidase Cu insertion factor (SCO1/SenC/PrrC family)